MFAKEALGQSPRTERTHSVKLIRSFKRERSGINISAAQLVAYPFMRGIGTKSCPAPSMFQPRVPPNTRGDDLPPPDSATQRRGSEFSFFSSRS